MAVQVHQKRYHRTRCVSIVLTHTRTRAISPRLVTRAVTSSASQLDYLGVPSDEEVMGYYVSHLKCSLDPSDDKYAAGQLHNLSRAGKPLLVEYNLDQLKGKLTRDILAKRAPTLWKVRVHSNNHMHTWPRDCDGSHRTTKNRIEEEEEEQTDE